MNFIVINISHERIIAQSRKSQKEEPHEERMVRVQPVPFRRKHYVAEWMLDKQKVKHSGNIEHKGLYSTDRAQVEALVEELNREGT